MSNDCEGVTVRLQRDYWAGCASYILRCAAENAVAGRQDSAEVELAIGLIFYGAGEGSEGQPTVEYIKKVFRLVRPPFGPDGAYAYLQAAGASDSGGR